MGVDRPAMRAGEDAAVVRVEVQSLMGVDQRLLAAVALQRKAERRDVAFIFGEAPSWPNGEMKWKSRSEENSARYIVIHELHECRIEKNQNN